MAVITYLPGEEAAAWKIWPSGNCLSPGAAPHRGVVLLLGSPPGVKMHSSVCHDNLIGGPRCRPATVLAVSLSSDMAAALGEHGLATVDESTAVIFLAVLAEFRLAGGAGLACGRY